MLDNLIQKFKNHNVSTLVYKVLAANDNSKNQVYFTRGDVAYETMKFLPSKNIEAVTTMKTSSFYAWLDFSWMNDQGNLSIAPQAKLILYPQYPEVRFSGFLNSCQNGPNDLMTTRQEGRVLFLGITKDKRIIGYVTSRDSQLAVELRTKQFESWKNVFYSIPISISQDDKSSLLAELSRIHQLEWIKSKKLNKQKIEESYLASNAGGYTLEAELGIKPNGDSLPDYKGWEVKQHSIGKNFEKPKHGRISLMTLKDPTGGYFGEHGGEAFIRRYGYSNPNITERMDFTGSHYFSKQNSKSQLTLVLNGFDSHNLKITNPEGGMILLDNNDNEAATWSFSELMQHWNRKHEKAVYIPSISSGEKPPKMYKYGSQITLCEGTNFTMLLNGIVSQKVIYDPGLKLENINNGPKYKSRNQLRLGSIKHVDKLYQKIENYNLNT